MLLCITELRRLIGAKTVDVRGRSQIDERGKDKLGLNTGRRYGQDGRSQVYRHVIFVIQVFKAFQAHIIYHRLKRPCTYLLNWKTHYKNIVSRPTEERSSPPPSPPRPQSPLPQLLRRRPLSLFAEIKRSASASASASNCRRLFRASFSEVKIPNAYKSNGQEIVGRERLLWKSTLLRYYF